MSEVKTLSVSSSPHIRGKRTTRNIMLDVILALVPALVGGVVFFGWRALVLTLVSCAACVFFEWGYRKIMKLDCTVGDLSAIVTGILIAFVLPVSTPIWILIIGDAFAIIFVKQLFGGIGQNFMNPALAARAFLLISWPVALTNWTANKLVDAATSATPLAEGVSAESIKLLDLFLGKTGGCIGEVSAMLLLIGGLYLVIRRVISVRIPLSFIGTVALLAFVFPQNGCDRLYSMGFQGLSGGVMLAAIFMATDYVTSPVTHWGQILFGIGCGALTIFIRYFGSYPEGVSFAILLMNACVGIFDRIGRKKRFGEVKQKEGAAK
ncbi:MAG: RnfABCDGE type electron transport complex subunit D [Clostridia bacterium]|nr:RnfABCDGE type electron transport complex subunit D [Clostridia bacterium]